MECRNRSGFFGKDTEFGFVHINDPNCGSFKRSCKMGSLNPHLKSRRGM